MNDEGEIFPKVLRKCNFSDHLDAAFSNKDVKNIHFSNARKMGKTREKVVVSMQVQMLTFTKIADGKFSVQLKRPNQIETTNSIQATESMVAIFNETYRIECNFMPKGSKGWKKKIVKITLFFATNDKKMEIHRWSVDVSQLYSKDAIDHTLELNNHSLLGDIKLHVGVYRGEPPTTNDNPDDAAENESQPANLQQTLIITQHRRTLSNMQHQRSNSVSNIALFTPAEELAEECSSISNGGIVKIHDIPQQTDKLASLIKNDTTGEIDKNKAVQQFLYSLIKFTNGNIEEKVYAYALTLHFYLSTKTVFTDSELENLVDSFNQSFDFTCSDLMNQYGNEIESGDPQTITNTANTIKNRLYKLGDGRFYKFAIQGLLFSFASSFDKETATGLCDAFGIDDPEFRDYINSIKCQKGKAQEISPFADQITNRLTQFAL